jgi:hypothetical protein
MGPDGSSPHSQVPPPVPILSQIDLVHASSHPTSWRSILILSYHPRLGLPSGLLPSGFPTISLYIPLLFPIRATCPSHLILLDLITHTIFGEEYRSVCSSLCNFLYSPRYLVHLRPKYSPQHPILTFPKPTFLPQCERPSFTPVQNKRQMYSSVYLDF